MPAVELNEAHVNARPEAAEWWAAFRARHEGTGRVSVIVASVGGDRVSIQMDDRLHAEAFRSMAAGRGVPLTAMRVIR